MGTLVSLMLLSTSDLGLDELLVVEVRIKMGVFLTVESIIASAPTAPDPVLRSKPTWEIIVRQYNITERIILNHLAVVDIDILERPT